MTDKTKIQDANIPPRWKICAAGTIGTLLAFVIAVLGGGGAAADTAGSDAQMGALVGKGLAIGLIVWCVVYFFALRRASKLAKWLVFSMIATGGIAGTLVQLSLNS